MTLNPFELAPSQHPTEESLLRLPDVVVDGARRRLHVRVVVLRAVLELPQMLLFILKSY